MPARRRHPRGVGDVCPCAGDRLDLRQGHRLVRRRAAGRDGDGDRVRRSSSRSWPSRPKAARTSSRACRSARSPSRSSSPASRRPSAPNVVITTGFNAGVDQKLEIGADDGRSHDLGGVAGRRHQEDHHRRDVHDGHPREHPDRARPVADHQHDARRAGRPQRRRLVVGPAGRLSLARHRAPTCSGTSKAGRSPTCRRTPRRRTSTSTRSSRSR